MPRKSSTAEKRGSMRDRKRERAHERRQLGGLGCIVLPEGVELFKHTARNIIDIVPYKISVTNSPNGQPGDIWDELEYWVHRNIGPEEKMVVCPKKTLGKRCPICERATQMSEDRNANEDDVKALWPKRRTLYNVVDVSGNDEAIMVWDISYHLFARQLDEELDNDEANEYSGYAELQGGMTLKVRMNEETFGSNKFFKTSRIDFDSREDYNEDILEETVDLDACLKVMEFDALEAMFLGTDNEPSTEEVPADPPPTASSRRRGTTVPTPDTDDLPPATTRRRGASAAPPPPDPAPAATTEGTCPDKHVFGTDCDDKPECQKCGDEWGRCRDAKDKLERDAAAAEAATKQAGASGKGGPRRKRGSGRVQG